MKRFARFAPLLVFAIALAPVALAQRRIIGSGDDVADAGPAPPAPPVDAGPAGKKDDKKKKPEDKKPEEKKKDVLEDTAAEKAAKAKDADAKAAAEKKAEEAAEAAKLKKEEDQKKLQDEKKAADAKKKLENKDQRLAAAKKIRQITRKSGDFAISVAIEPGQIARDGLLEVRVDVAQKLDVPDPKYGNLLPIRSAEITATLSGGKGKQRYAVHALETPGRYGFHTTPVKDGLVQVSITGTTKDNKSFEATFPLHVGVWPPPDFEDEEKNNLATTDASRGGRKVLGGNE